MTTSTEKRQPSLSTHGDHWLEMTATLSRESTDEFGDWLGDELAKLEKELYTFITPRSLTKGSQRQPSSTPVA